MPELPEVETIRRELAPAITGSRFTSVELFWEQAVKAPSANRFRERVCGQVIESLGRRGKYLLFKLREEDTLILHLKMTGALLLSPSSQKLQKHTTAIFELDGGSYLHFVDQRKFGALWLLKDVKTVIGKLGPEPLDASFTPAFLGQIIQRRGIPIKVLLCDQQAVAGIGNMWADEALFAARIHPLRAANSLSGSEVEELHSAIRRVMQRGIEYKGASINTYLLPNGERGTAHNEFKVAHRLNQLCVDCVQPLSRIMLRGRGTYFCPNCQPEAPS